MGAQRSIKDRAGEAARQECSAQQREFIAEMLGFVVLYAGQAQGFLAAGDDAGAGYTIEKMGLYVREAIKAKIELAEFKREAR